MASQDLNELSNFMRRSRLATITSHHQKSILSYRLHEVLQVYFIVGIVSFETTMHAQLIPWNCSSFCELFNLCIALVLFLTRKGPLFYTDFIALNGLGVLMRLKATIHSFRQKSRPRKLINRNSHPLLDYSVTTWPTFITHGALTQKYHLDSTLAYWEKGHPGRNWI